MRQVKHYAWHESEAWAVARWPDRVC